MDKAPEAFRTISEVAEELDVPQHVLRFWESRFPLIRPLKRGGGRRYYRPDDIDLLRGIRHLLYGEGYTIRGVQRILHDQGPHFVQVIWKDSSLQVPRLHDAVEDKGADDIAEKSESAEGGEALAHRLSKAPSQGGLGREDLQVLKQTLRELDECKRALDDALVDGA